MLSVNSSCQFKNMLTIVLTLSKEQKLCSKRQKRVTMCDESFQISQGLQILS